MFRFRMNRDDECERCREVKTYRHLFRECRESRRVWRLFNEYVEELNKDKVKWRATKMCLIIALVLVLVKCYDNKKVFAALLLTHPSIG